MTIDGVSAFLQKYFSLVVILGLVLGFVIPGLDRVPKQTTLVMLAMLIFVSSFQIELSDARLIRVNRVGVLYVARFILLPLVLWWLAQLMDPTLALGVLLLSLAPTGVAAPGVTGVYGGNVSLTLLVVLVSSIMAPFVIPGMVGLLVGREIEIDLLGIFQTLLVTIAVPLSAYLALRRRRQVVQWVRRFNTLLVVPLIAGLVAVVISQQRQFMREHLNTTIVYFGVTVAVTALYYTFGWVLGLREEERVRVSYTLGSGVINNALAIVVGFLYFESAISVFLVTSELAWVLAMVTIPPLLGRMSRAGGKI